MKTRTIAIWLGVVALVLAACGGGGGDGDGGGGGGDTPAAAGAGEGGDAANGEKVFLNTCASCHGADAMGIEGLGKAMKGSDFVSSTSEADLYTLIITGRPASDPANTTGVDMPPKGGNPSLNDQSIADVIAYLKSLN